MVSAGIEPATARGLVNCLLCAEGVRGPHRVACISMYHHRDGFAWGRVDPTTVLVSESPLLVTVAWHDDVEVPDCVRLLVPRVLREVEVASAPGV